MKTPADKSVVFSLFSHPMKDVKDRWRATLTFAANSTDESDAILEIADGEGTPIASGVFVFAGASIPVVNGKGLLSCRTFVQGKHDRAIWLHRKGTQPVPGALTFA